MSIAALGQRRIVFFGGKGGVGKTTLAAAFAVSVSPPGARTLLVSTDPAHSTADILETPLGDEPREIVDGLWALEIDPAAEADRYIRDVKDRIARTTPPRLWDEVERQIDIARVTPGAEEAALGDRVARLLEDEGRGFQRVVFDTAPLGHTLRLLALPEQMGTWIRALIGRRKKLNALTRMWRNVAGAAAGDERPRDAVLDALEERAARFARTRAVMTNTAETAFAFVLTPERLPILETQRAVTVMHRYGIPVAAVIVNRVLPPEGGGAFVERRRAREREYLAQIEATFDPALLIRVRLQDADVVGIPALRRLGAQFGARGPADR